MLLFIFKAIILLKISFLIVHSETKSILLLIPGLLHISTLIIVFTSVT